MSIRLEQLTKRFDGKPVVSNVTLEVAAGELCVMLGPSGSGKSTILRLIAGLAPLDAGRILLEGADITGVPARERNLGFVFQHYALFRHQSVAENVEFALRVRGVSSAERRTRRDELLELVGLAGLGGRLPAQLSGGQQQRVALARALAHRPRVLLLDEPFGALDARIRLELRRALLAIQHELKVTTLFVTHDQEEAFELADRLAVMAQGRLIEDGPAHELYLRPQTEFVAVFLGGANLWVGETSEAGVRLGPLEMPLTGGVPSDAARKRLQVLVRPEDVSLRQKREELNYPALGEGEVVETAFSGAIERVRVRLPGIPGVRVIHPPAPFGDDHLAVDAARQQHVARREPLKPGDPVWVGVRRLHALLHPGLSFVSMGDGAAGEFAAELARLAQARLAKVDQPRELTDRLAREDVDLVFAGLSAEDAGDEAESLLELAGDAHLLLVRAASAVPRRFLVSVAVGEPGKDDVAFVGRLARHLGSTATVLTVLEPSAGAFERKTADRFLAGCVRTLARFGVVAEPMAVVGDVADEIARAMKEGHDLLALGSPLPDAQGRVRWRRSARALLESSEKYPILIVHGAQRLRGSR
jgi:sulfate transport system ATP-binding protein